MHIVAYLDANSASQLTAAIAAGFAGVAVAFTVFWRRITGFFSPKRRRDAPAADAADDA